MWVNVPLTEQISSQRCSFCERMFDKSNKRWEGIFSNTVISGAVGHFYCNKFCAKQHERELILEGFIPDIDTGDVVVINRMYTVKDDHGNPIWFPKSGKPYYDKALGKTFQNVQEKATYMKDKGLVMDGSMDKPNLPIEAGDMRSRERRKKLENYGI